MIIPRSVGVHDGVFHADEVTAVALLIVFDLVDLSQVVRTRDPKILERCEFICDVGGVYDPKKKRFDHHQADYKGNLSSAGMVLQHAKESGVIDSALYHFLNHTLIRGIDAEDNGIVCAEKGVCTFSAVIADFLPIGYNASAADQMNAFQEALAFSIGHLRRTIQRYQYNLSSRKIVKELMEKSEKVLIFDEALSWMESFFALGGEKHPALFVIMPTNGQWKLRGIPPNLNERMKVRKPLPESWAGLHEEDLKKVSKIQGAVFCHKGRFISIWETKKDALQALSLVLNEESITPS